MKLSAFPVQTAEGIPSDGRSTIPLKDSELPWYRRWWVVAAFGTVIFSASAVAVAIISGNSVARDSEAVVRP